MSNTTAQRLPAEQRYQDELQHLITHDQGQKPKGWQLSPRMVRTFILGSDGKEIEGKEITRKIYGNDGVVERAIVTLIGDRGLILVGEPGTAKSVLSELLSAAISGNSTHTIQGSAGIFEENIRYSWNYALLLKDGPSLDALVPGPLYDAMHKGELMRFEELTRCPTEVQDNLIPIMSDRILHIPEMKDNQSSYLLSTPGFNIIATANLKDRGVNEMSAALKRRFNFETMRPLSNQKDQTQLICDSVNKQLRDNHIPISLNLDIAEVLATAFNDMRDGKVEGVAIESPTTVLSTAEAISIAFNAAAQCHYFGESKVQPKHLSEHFLGTVIKDNNDDIKRFKDYLRVVKRKRKDHGLWQNFVENTQLEAE